MCFATNTIGCCAYNIRHYKAGGETKWRRRWEKNSDARAWHGMVMPDGRVAIVGERADSNNNLKIYGESGEIVWQRDASLDLQIAMSGGDAPSIFMNAVGVTADYVVLVWGNVAGRAGWLWYDHDGNVVGYYRFANNIFGNPTFTNPFRHRCAVSQDNRVWNTQGVTAWYIDMTGGPPSEETPDGGTPPDYVGGKGTGTSDVEGADVDVDDEADPQWVLTAPGPTRYDYDSNIPVWGPGEINTASNAHAGRLSSGDVIGGGHLSHATGTPTQPLRIYDWASGTPLATWPTNGPDDGSWTVYRVRSLRPTAGAIASLSAFTGGIDMSNVIRMDDAGEITWRHKHAVYGFSEFAVHPDGAVTGLCFQLEHSRGERSFVDVDAT